MTHNLASPEPETSPWLQYALGYAANGWPVLPLYSTNGATCSCPKGANCGANAGKHPRTLNGVTDATTDPDTIRRWAQQWPESNLAIAIPAGLAVVDVDPRNNGDVSLAALEKAHSELPPTFTADTGGGGKHFVYRLESADDRLPGRLGPGLDVKQEGGYVVVAPSVHASGKLYAWTDHRAPVSAPAWLQAKTHKRGTQQRSSGSVVCELLEPVWTTEVHTQLAALIEPYFDHGRKHHSAFGLGGWIKQRGGSSGDAAEILALLPSADPQARIQDALDAYTRYGDSTYGYKYLIEHGIPADVIDTWRDACPKAFSGTMPDGFEWARPGKQANDADTPPQPVDALLSQFGVVQSIDDVGETETYCIEGLPFHAGAVNGIAGGPGCAKTPFASYLVVCLRTGVDFFGRKVLKPGTVLVASCESPSRMRRTLKRIARKLGVTTDGITFVKFDPGALADKRKLATFKALAARFDYTFVDTYNGAVSGINHNDSTFADPMKHLEIEGRTVFVTTHTKKGEDRPDMNSLQGTGALGGAMKAIVGLWRPKGGDDYTFSVCCVRKPELSFDDFSFRINDVATLENTKWGLELAPVDNPEGADDSADGVKQTERARLTALGHQLVGAFANSNVNDSKTLMTLVGELNADAADVKKACKVACELGWLRETKKAPLTWTLLQKPVPTAESIGFGAPPLKTRLAPTVEQTRANAAATAAAEAAAEARANRPPAIPGQHTVNAPASALPAGVVGPTWTTPATDARETTAEQSAPPTVPAKPGRLPESAAELEQVLGGILAATAADGGRRKVDGFTVSEVLSAAGVPDDRAHQVKLGALMKEHGYVGRCARVGKGKRETVYRK